MKFAEEPGYFSSAKARKADEVFGEIVKDGRPLCAFEGSWLKNLRFGSQLYWELETTEVIRVALTEPCLPSDCRFREDSLAVAAGDMKLAAEEKHRLEVLQRADRTLREQAEKRRKQ